MKRGGLGLVLLQLRFVFWMLQKKTHDGVDVRLRASDGLEAKGALGS